MALRGERYIAAALTRLPLRRHRRAVRAQAASYWGSSEDVSWNENSHWRDALGDDTWIDVGREHWVMYNTFAAALGRTSPGIVIDWGCGGGANAAAFAPHAERFVGCDVSAASLTECAEQVREAAGVDIETRLIDLDDPAAAVTDLRNLCSTFLCVYVIELTASRDDAVRILHVAHQVLAPGGMALVQVKYHTDRRSRGWAGVRYTRNIASTTTFAIDEFWTLAESCGLHPELIRLVPESRLDSRYAYYALVKKHAD